jgi:hypothetical protein
MIAFMPWCRVEKSLDVGGITILPFHRHGRLEGLDEATLCRANTILGTYKTIEAKPVDKAALIRYGAKSLVDELSTEEHEDIHGLVTLACFSALAGRQYFDSLGPYCNSDCFTLYVQKFDRADFTAITTRRREGETLSGWPIDDIAITIPVHCHTVQEVMIDESLLKSLLIHRDKCDEEEWGRWQNAITCFNQANTDSETVRFQVEWVLLCSSFEHILLAASDYKNVARKFIERVIPSSPLLVRNAKRKSTRWVDVDVDLRYEWLKEFYRIRGDFAHGRLDSRQPAAWTTREHLVLSTIAFPLLVRCLLASSGSYVLTDDDLAQINAFECLMDDPFLESPPDSRGSGDSYWARHVSEARMNVAHGQAMKHLEAKGFFDEQANT